MTDQYLKQVTKPVKTAFALSCGNNIEGASCLVSGRDDLANLIIEYAKASNIPVEQNQTLANILEAERPQSYLSSKAVQVLAEVIAALYIAEQKAA